MGGREEVGGAGIEQKGKRTRGHGHQCRDRGRSIKGVNGNGKNTLESFKK